MIILDDLFIILKLCNRLCLLSSSMQHSCEPNLFVQNVFVDTHDIRFPWVAFFTKANICAGTELTWDYGYVVGSVDGKVIPCYCGSKHCRKRLL